MAGFERGVRPIGLWSMSITRSMASSPSTPADGRRLVGDEVERARGHAIERVVHQRGLARSGDARHAGEEPHRERNVDALQVVAARFPELQLLLRLDLAALVGDLDALAPGEVLAGERGGVGLDLDGRAFGNDAPAMDTGAGAEVHHVVRLADRVLVVLDDDHGIAEVAQAVERIQQALVVALVQADRGLVEDVHDADEPGADLAREADALRLAARERFGAAVERQVVEADVDQEAEAIGDLLDDLRRDLLAPALERERVEELERAADGQGTDRGQRGPADEHECARPW